jgi:hypothetical protein
MEFKHLKEVKMTYIEHFIFSGNLSFMLFIGAIKALIHSLYPDVYITSSSDLSDKLSNELSYKNKKIN